VKSKSCQELSKNILHASPSNFQIIFVNDQKRFWLPFGHLTLLWFSFNQERFNHQTVIKTLFGHQQLNF
jgi:hypothetical protein